MAKKPALGLLLPVERGSNGYFNVGYEAMTQVRSNLTNLILTKRGERVFQPSFGCGIHSLLFEEITDNLISQAKGYVEEAVQIWMPFVSIDNLDITKNEDENEVVVKLTYSLKANIRFTDTITLVLEA